MFDKLTPREKEAVATAYGNHQLQTNPQQIATWYNNLDDDLQKTAAQGKTKAA